VTRWLKFSTVGIAGTGVQLLALALLLKLHMNYLAATVLAVETALVHNYLWHQRWTWRGRLGSFWRFQLSSGLVSIVSNVALMRLLTGWAGMPPIPANLSAIALTALMNFRLGDRWVFHRSALRASSTVARSESRGTLAIIGLTIQPNPAGISRDSEIARHSR
jgi:putative flippase GtrA